MPSAFLRQLFEALVEKYPGHDFQVVYSRIWDHPFVRDYDWEERRKHREVFSSVSPVGEVSTKENTLSMRTEIFDEKSTGEPILKIYMDGHEVRRFVGDDASIPNPGEWAHIRWVDHSPPHHNILGRRVREVRFQVEHMREGRLSYGRED